MSVAAPAEKIEHSARAKLLDEIRTTLARLRQAGMKTEDLLKAMQREVLAMNSEGQANSSR